MPISPVDIKIPAKNINPAIIIPVSVSIIGVALIKTVPIFICFSVKSLIASLDFFSSISSL